MSGTLYRTANNSYGHTTLDKFVFVDDDAGLNENNADALESADESVVFETQGHNDDAEARARCWFQLNAELLETLEFDEDLEDMHGVDVKENADVPLLVAREGNPRIAAYLFAHGVSKDTIAYALDVGERTVSQYISDVKKGER